MILLEKQKNRYALVVILSLCLIMINSSLAFANTDSSDSNPISAVAEPAPTNEQAMDNSTQNIIIPVLDANGQQVSPGTLPISPFYWLAGMIKKIQLFLTFDPAQKVALKEHQALQKLAAAREMVKKGKPDIAQKVMEDYTQNITEAQTLLGKLKDPNSQSVQNLEIALAKADAANIPVLSQLLDKLPQQVAQEIAGNILKSMQQDVNKLSGDQKETIKVGLISTTKKLDTTNLKKQTQTTLVNFQQTLGLTPSTDTEKATNALLNDNSNKASSNVVNGEEREYKEKEDKIRETANKSDSKGQKEGKENSQVVNHTTSSESSYNKKRDKNNDNEEERYGENEGHGGSEDD